MNLTPGKSHLTALDILIELRGWLADNIQMQARGSPAKRLSRHNPQSHLTGGVFLHFKESPHVCLHD